MPTDGTLKRLLFDTDDPEAIDHLVSGFCAARLGSEVTEVRFRETSVGAVFGVVLADGQPVLVKVHRVDESPQDTLVAIHTVQQHLWSNGFPCPRPLLAPTPLCNGTAVVEQLLETGSARDTHDELCRRRMAEALALHLELCSALGALPALDAGFALIGGSELWPARLHSPIFDFAATAAGAEWIDAIAAAAKARAVRPSEVVIGHCDWSGKHFRFADERVSAVYDWDSVRLRPRAAIVGCAAMTFTTNFTLPGIGLAPSPEEMGAFIDEYTAARGTPMGRDERARVTANALLIGAYTARCEHCVDPASFERPDSFGAALKRWGTAYLEC